MNTDYQERLRIFADTIKGIVEHNSNPSHTWKKGINKYSDMTYEEFKTYFHIVSAE